MTCIIIYFKYCLFNIFRFYIFAVFQKTNVFWNTFINIWNANIPQYNLKSCSHALINLLYLLAASTLKYESNFFFALIVLSSALIR